MIAINIRGTGGSGKSTLVQKIMKLYRNSEVVHVEGRKQPLFSQHWDTSVVSDVLRVPGHYNTACGGCDTIKTPDQVYSILNEAIDHTHHVLFEGIMVMDDVRRAVELDKRLKAETSPTRAGGRLHVIALTTPIEECLTAIRNRRTARGETKPLNEKNTRQRYERCLRGLTRLRDAGVAVEKLDRDAAYARVKELLGLDDPVLIRERELRSQGVAT